mmetsp:Transcript_5912/g.10683  ORF Transcript_5912/g.10683 Transcript_5912/m.10683 type:complete len:82 (+) Transcript_5912:183-428(+)
MNRDDDDDTPLCSEWLLQQSGGNSPPAPYRQEEKRKNVSESLLQDQESVSSGEVDEDHLAVVVGTTAVPVYIHAGRVDCCS